MKQMKPMNSMKPGNMMDETDLGQVSGGQYEVYDKKDADKALSCKHPNGQQFGANSFYCPDCKSFYCV